MLGAVFTPKSSSVSSYRATVLILPQNLATPNAEAFVPVSCICAWDRDMHTGRSIPKDQSNIIIPASGNRLGQGHGMDTRGPRSHPRTRCHQTATAAGGEVPSPPGGCHLAPCVVSAPCTGAAPQPQSWHEQELLLMGHTMGAHHNHPASQEENQPRTIDPTPHRPGTAWMAGPQV